ncbi:MAG TPA: CobD/CbiB family protein [Thiobacillus sp.]
MAFFSVLAAVALEHVRPLRRRLPHYQQYTRFILWLDRRLNAGEYSHGAIAWTLAVLPVVVGVWLVFAVLNGISPFLGWVWNVAVLYATMGFKYFSDMAEQIARLLRAGDLDGAREKLVDWRGGDASEFSEEDITRITIEQTMASSHRQMFGVLFWFVLLIPLGPVGAVLFRCGSILSRRWVDTQGRFGYCAQRVFHAINWLPSRLTAVTYAIAGNFEEATFCWRTQADAWPETEEGVVVAAGAGAMGLRLGQAINVGGETVWRPELGTGQLPEVDSINSAVSMIWRGLMIWLIAGLLVVIAGWAA